jgi:hypothetical protein
VLKILSFIESRLFPDLAPETKVKPAPETNPFHVPACTITYFVLITGLLLILGDWLVLSSLYILESLPLATPKTQPRTLLDVQYLNSYFQDSKASTLK